MPRKICITAADGQTGHLVAELILTDEEFSSSIEKLTLIAMDTKKCSDLKTHGAAIVQHCSHRPAQPGQEAGAGRRAQELRCGHHLPHPTCGAGQA